MTSASDSGTHLFTGALMRFQFENLGLLDQADLEISNLTIICGENNTGKTYATYGIYGFLRDIRSYLRLVLRREKSVASYFKNTTSASIDLQEIFSGKINDYLLKSCEIYKSDLPQAFSSPTNLFKETNFTALTSANCDFFDKEFERIFDIGDSKFISLKKLKKSNHLVVLSTSEEFPDLLFAELIIDAIINIVFLTHLPRVHISSVERTGAAVFRGELDAARARLINRIRNNEVHNFSNKHVLKEINSKISYSWPVEDNVEFARQLESLDKETSSLATEKPEIIEAFHNIIGGTYKSVGGKIVFQSKDRKDISFTMSQSSSSARSLLDIGFYLRCKAEIGDLLIIDEPELSLHPKSQRAFARLLGRLVNAGIKVFITTHSDYIIKELNTLIMLHQANKNTNNVMNDYGYTAQEIINPENTRLYITKKIQHQENKPKTHLERVMIDKKYGIEVETFDKEIMLMNEIQEQLIYGE